MYPPLYRHAIWREYINFYSTSNTAKLLLYINLVIFKNYGYKITNSIISLKSEIVIEGAFGKHLSNNGLDFFDIFLGEEVSGKP